MYKTQAEEVKDWLKAYVQNEVEIDELLGRLRTIKAKAMSVGAAELSDMPKGSPGTRDTLAEYMIRVDELEKEISKRIEDHKASKRAIEQVLDKMESVKQRRIIMCRYVYGMEWTDVIYQCYHDKKDYQLKFKAYQKRVYRDHERALLEMARKWGEK